MAKKIVVEFAGETASLDRAFAKVKQTSSGLEGAFQGLVATAAIGGISDQLYSAVQAASSLNESLSKSNNVFGTNGQAIDLWAKNAAESIGLSHQAALEAASSFGNMFSQLGVGSAQAATLSTKIVGLAADFASFHNADITQVIEAQQSAFRGEYDALQRFLPTISAAAVQQEALKETGKKTTDALTDQEKALAVNTLMFQGAGAAQGDFARTSGGLANQQRILTAEMDNLKTEVGNGLLPIMTDVVSFLAHDAIPAFEQFLGLTKNPPKADGFEGFTTKIKDGLTDVEGWLVELPNPILKLGGLFSHSMKEAAGSVDELSSKLHASSAERAGWAADIASVDAMQKLATASSKNLVTSTAQQAAASTKTAKALADEKKATQDLADAKLAVRSSELSLEESTHALGQAQDDYNKFLETGGIDIDKVKTSEDALIAAQKDVEAATNDVTKAQEEFNKAQEKASPKEAAKAGRDVASASDDVTAAQLDLTDAQDEYAKVNLSTTATEEEKTRAWLRANEASRTLADAQDHLSEATTAQTATANQGTASTDAYKQAKTNLDTATGALKEATDKQTAAQTAHNTAQALGKTYTDDLWKVTDSLKSAQLDLDTKTWGAQKAQAALDTQLKTTTGSVRDQWGNVAGLSQELKDLPTEVQIAINTMFTDPQAALAGITHDTGNIIAGATRAAGGAGGGNTTIINMNGIVDNAGAARAIRDLLDEDSRRGSVAVRR